MGYKREVKMVEGGKDKAKNPMRDLRIRKLCLNICVGESGDRLTRAGKVINLNQDEISYLIPLVEDVKSLCARIILNLTEKVVVFCLKGAGVFDWSNPSLLQGPLHRQIFRH